MVCVREVQFCCLCFTLTALVMCFLYAFNLMQLHVTMHVWDEGIYFVCQVLKETQIKVHTKMFCFHM